MSAQCVSSSVAWSTGKRSSLVVDAANVLGMLQPHDNAVPTPIALACGHSYNQEGIRGSSLVDNLTFLSLPFNLNDVALWTVNNAA